MEETWLFFFLNKKETKKIEKDILGIIISFVRKEVWKECYRGANSPTLYDIYVTSNVKCKEYNWTH